MTETTNHAADPGRIADLQQQIRAGSLTASALVERYLARIDKVDPHVKPGVSSPATRRAPRRPRSTARPRPAIGAVRCTASRSASRTSSTSPASRPWPTAGRAPTARRRPRMPTSSRRCGSPARVVLGKTHTTEFAYFDPSPGAQPPPYRTYARRLVERPRARRSAPAWWPLALGTQTVASVNRPAAYCGVAAFKPSTQSTCTHGATPLSPTFDTIGFYGATVLDAVALYETVAPAFFAPADNDRPARDRAARGSRARQLRSRNPRRDRGNGQAVWRRRAQRADRGVAGVLGGFVRAPGPRHAIRGRAHLPRGARPAGRPDRAPSCARCSASAWRCPRRPTARIANISPPPAPASGRRLPMPTQFCFRRRADRARRSRLDRRPALHLALDRARRPDRHPADRISQQPLADRHAALQPARQRSRPRPHCLRAQHAVTGWDNATATKPWPKAATLA